MTQHDDLKANIQANLLGDIDITLNMKQEVVMTTRDKIKVALHETLPRYASIEQLLAWLALCVGLLLTLLTADFRDVLGIPGEAMASVVGVGTVISGGLTIREFFRWRNRVTLDAIADRIISDATRPPENRTP